MLKLKLQSFGHVMRRADSSEKTLTLGKVEGERGRGRQRVRWLDGITDSTDMRLSKLPELGWTGRPGVLQSMRSQRVRHDWVTEQQHHQGTRSHVPQLRICMLQLMIPSAAHMTQPNKLNIKKRRDSCQRVIIHVPTGSGPQNFTSALSLRQTSQDNTDSYISHFSRTAWF